MRNITHGVDVVQNIQPSVGFALPQNGIGAMVQ